MRLTTGMFQFRRLCARSASAMLIKDEPSMEISIPASEVSRVFKLCSKMMRGGLVWYRETTHTASKELP